MHYKPISSLILTKTKQTIKNKQISIGELVLTPGWKLFSPPKPCLFQDSHGKRKQSKYSMMLSHEELSTLVPLSTPFTYKVVDETTAAVRFFLIIKMTGMKNNLKIY